MTRVLVSVGTHEQPFQRLLDSLLNALPAFPNVDFVVQFGVGQWPASLPFEAKPYFEHHEMQRQLAAADLLVTQASPGNVFGALEAGAWPLVLGRSHSFGEHVDDHQVHFADAVQELGLGVNIGDAQLLGPRLAQELQVDPGDRSMKCMKARAGSSRRAATFHLNFWESVKVVMKTNDA